MTEVFALLISVAAKRAARSLPFADLADTGLARIERALSTNKVRDLRRLLCLVPERLSARLLRCDPRTTDVTGYYRPPVAWYANFSLDEKSGKGELRSTVWGSRCPIYRKLSKATGGSHGGVNDWRLRSSHLAYGPSLRLEPSRLTAFLSGSTR